MNPELYKSVVDGGVEAIRAWRAANPDVRLNLSGADLRHADLCSADLRRTDLYGADLYGADLSGANLHGAKSIVSIGPGGSREDMLYAITWPDGYRIRVGCWWGTLEGFRLQVGLTHGDSRHGLYYQAVCDFLLATEKAALVKAAVSPSDIQGTPPAS